MTVFVIPPVVGSPVLTLSVHARTGIRRPAAAWTPFERNPPMRLTVPTLNEMEDRGLAFLAGVVYVYSSLPDEKVDAALAVDYDALEWESEPVAVRLESPKRGLLHRFAYRSTDGTALRYFSAPKKFTHITVELIQPTILSLQEMADDFLERAVPVRFSKGRPSMRGVALHLGDRSAKYSTFLHIDPKNGMLVLLDHEPDPPSHARARATTVMELRDAEANAVRREYRARLAPLRLHADTRFNSNWKIQIQ